MKKQTTSLPASQLALYFSDRDKFYAGKGRAYNPGAAKLGKDFHEHTGKSSLISRMLFTMGIGALCYIFYLFV